MQEQPMVGFRSGVVNVPASTTVSIPASTVVAEATTTYGSSLISFSSNRYNNISGRPLYVMVSQNVFWDGTISADKRATYLQTNGGAQFAYAETDFADALEHGINASAAFTIQTGGYFEWKAVNYSAVLAIDILTNIQGFYSQIQITVLN